MPTLATLQAQAEETDLVRKVQRVLIVMAPMSVDMPEELTDAESLPIDLMAADFKPVGLITPDGFTFTPEFESEGTSAMGHAAPIRSDVMSATRKVSFTTLEKGRRHMHELVHGADYSSVQPTAGGEIIMPVPELPIGTEYRLIAVGDDGPAEANWILGWSFGRTKLSSVGPETWGQEGALQREITLDVFVDEEIGVPVKEHIGGTGALKHIEKLGFGTPAV